MTTGQPHPHRRPDLRHPQIAGSAQPNPAAGTGSAGFASAPFCPGQQARGKRS